MFNRMKAESGEGRVGDRQPEAPAEVSSKGDDGGDASSGPTKAKADETTGAMDVDQGTQVEKSVSPEVAKVLEEVAAGTTSNLPTFMLPRDVWTGGLIEVDVDSGAATMMPLGPSTQEEANTAMQRAVKAIADDTKRWDEPEFRDRRADPNWATKARILPPGRNFPTHESASAMARLLPRGR